MRNQGRAASLSCIESIERRVLFAAGDLMPSFGQQGVAKAGASVVADIYMTAMVRLQDGDLLFAGSTQSPAGRFFARSNSDGSLDTQFGTNGVIRDDSWANIDAMAQGFDGLVYFSTSTAVGVKSIRRMTTDGVVDTTYTPGSLTGREVYRVVPQPDGSVFVVQPSGLTKLTSTGSFDSTFGTNGRAPLPSAGVNQQLWVSDFAFQSDGKILVTAQKWSQLSTNVNLALIRYTANGQLDTSYGVGGYLNHPSITTGDYFDRATVAMAAGDKPIVAINPSSQIADVGRVIRFTSQGVVDNTFAINGIVNLGVSGKDVDVREITIRSDGDIVVSGSITDDAAPNLWISALFRLTPGGAVDTAFDGDGRFEASLPVPGYLAGAYLDATSSSFYLAGWARESFMQSQAIGVYAVTEAGQLDSRFGTGGRAMIHFNEPASLLPWSLAVKPDGRILVGAMSRWTASPWTLKQFTAGGVLESVNFDLPQTAAFSARATQILPLADGKVLMVGLVGEPPTNATYIAVVRTLANGTPDTSFAPGGMITLSDINYAFPIDAALDSTGRCVILTTRGGLFRVGTNGVVETLNVDLDTNNIINTFSQIIPLSNGNMLVTGQTAGESQIVCFMVDSGGQPVAGFGTNGQAPTNVAGGVYTYGAHVDTQGRIRLLGVSQQITGSGPTLKSIRFTATGALDTSFGTGGVVDSGVLASDHKFYYLGNVVFDADGAAYVAGWISQTSGNAQFVARLGAGGTFDAGVPLKPFGYASRSNFFMRLAKASDGNLLVLAHEPTADGAESIVVSKVEFVTPPPVTGSISGVTFDDKNNNGLLDTGEPKTSGKTVFLDANNNGKLDSGETSAKTSTTGDYAFTGLGAGTYYVRRVFPSGYTYSNSPLDLVVAAGQNISNANIGSVPVGAPPPPPPPTGQTGSISGFTFDDKNKNGLLDTGETKTSGKTVFLDSNNNGKLDTGEKSTKSSTSGAYAFTNLTPGTYYVRRVFPSGYTYSNAPLDLALAAGQSITNANIGSIPGTVTPPPPPPTGGTGSISGFLFWDADRDGAFDSGEDYQSGKTVFIDRDDDNILDSNEARLTTDSQGRFTFSGLSAGTYVIKRVVPKGYAITTPKQTVTLTAGQIFSGVAIGTNTN